MAIDGSLSNMPVDFILYYLISKARIKMRKYSIVYLYFVIEIIFCFLLWKKPLLLAITLMLLFLVGWKKIYNNLEKIIWLVALVLGTLGERLCVYLNIWSYQYVTVFDLPLWLPLAWGNAGVCIHIISCHIYEELFERCKLKKADLKK